jgi:hypothetical protein
LTNKIALFGLVLMLSLLSVPIASAQAKFVGGYTVFIVAGCNSPYDAPPAGITLSFGGETISVFCLSGYGSNGGGVCLSVSAFSVYRVSSFAGTSHSSQKGAFSPVTGGIGGAILSPITNSHGQPIAYSEAGWIIGLGCL